MFYTILDDLILYQQLSIKPSRYTNYILKLHNYFYNKTEIDPSFIINIKIESIDFLFFFVNRNKYFQAKTYLNSMRREFRVKKILIIMVDNTLINLLFNLFPDLCIDDIKLEIDNVKGKYEVLICFLKGLNTYHIAVGQNGVYIKAINELFEKHVNFSNNTQLIIKCTKTD